MRVPVFMLLPSQEPLRNSAAAFAARKRAPSLRDTRMPDGIQIDRAFPALPVGTGIPGQMSARDLSIDTSEQFVVRGFIEVESPEAIPETIDGNPIQSDPKIAHFLTCGGSAPVGDAKAVAAALHTSALHARGLDGAGVAIAIMDTGINLAHLRTQLGTMPRLDAANSWRAPGNSNMPGAHPIDHGTMCAFDALIAAPKATLIDCPILSAAVPGGGAVTGSRLSAAVPAFSQLLSSWAIGYVPGGLSQYKGLVISNSWGIFHPSWDFPAGHPGRYIDNPNHAFTLLIGVLARMGADILFAAGNCGAQCADGRCQGRTTDTIMGANACGDVLTVAGCDNGGTRVGYSSQGPSIAPMVHDKPDVTAYTHFKGSEAFGAGSPDSGTSAACPVAAGCVAALRSKIAPAAAPPANLFAQIRATARPAGGGAGWNGDYGYGIMDPDATAQSLGV